MSVVLVARCPHALICFRRERRGGFGLGALEMDVDFLFRFGMRDEERGGGVDGANRSCSISSSVRVSKPRWSSSRCSTVSSHSSSQSRTSRMVTSGEKRLSSTATSGERCGIIIPCRSYFLSRLTGARAFEEVGPPLVAPTTIRATTECRRIEFGPCRFTDDNGLVRSPL